MGTKVLSTIPLGMGIVTTEVQGDVEEEVGEEEKQWKGMKEFMEEI